jgi:hypothetical protein
LAFLSRLIGPNAHGWITLAAIWLSLALLIQAILRTPKALVRWCLLLVCLGGIFLTALLSAEFTITAGVLFGAAIANWLAAGSQGENRLLSTAAIFLALVLSYLIRPESYEIGLAITLPALALLCWPRQSSTRHARVMVFSLASIFAIGLVTDRIAYATSPEWKLVPEYNDLRAQFNDYRRVPWRADSPEYERVGWTSNDYLMFVALYSRSPIYSFENISFLVRTLAIPRSATAITRIWDWFYYPLSNWPLLIVLLVQVIGFGLLEARHRLLGALILLGEVVAIALAALIGKLAVEGFHVWFTGAAITLMCICASLVSGRPTKDSKSSRTGFILVGGLGIVAAALIWSGHCEDTQDARAYRRWVNQNQDQLKGKVTVWGIGLKWESLVTPTRIYPPFPSLKVAAIDDLNHMPVETTMLKELGIDDLAKELGTDPSMHLVCPKDLIERLTRFCQEHYGITPIFKSRAEWGESAIYTLDRP